MHPYRHKNYCGPGFFVNQVTPNVVYSYLYVFLWLVTTITYVTVPTKPVF